MPNTTTEPLGLEDVIVLLLREATEVRHTTHRNRGIEENTRNGLYRTGIRDCLEILDTTPFSFDEIYDASIPREQYGELLCHLDRLEEREHVGRLQPRRRVALTQQGLERADRLHENASTDQRTAVTDAYATVTD